MNGPLITADNLRRARVRYAEAFLRFRLNAKSDGQAHQQAIVETSDEITVLEAEHFVAKINAAAGACGCLVGEHHAPERSGPT